MLRLLAAALLVSCAHPPPPPPPRPAPTTDAMEAHLLATHALHLGFRSQAEGAVTGDIEGTLDLGQDGVLELVGQGTFMGKPVHPELHAEGEKLTGGDATRFEEGRPPALEEGLFVGLIRMGLLHDLSLLIEGSPPAATDGTVKEWVKIDTEHDLGLETHAGHQAYRVEYTMHAGTPGDGQLWIDAASGLPIERILTVHFKQGDMRVTETYAWSGVTP